MAECDYTIIQQHANKLSSRAASIALFYTVGAAIVCALLGYIADMMLGRYLAADNYPLLFLGLVAGGIGGFWIGTDKAISLRLQAQIALCQINIGDTPDNARRKTAD